MIVLVLLCGCDSECIERDASQWCHHESASEGDCGTPELEATYRCDRFDVAEGPLTNGAESHYFDRRGNHVASRFTTDVDNQCGGFEYWYGRRIQCDPVCAYDQDYAEVLPRCSALGDD